MNPLFTSFTIGNVALRNRFVMAPMARGRACNGVPTDQMVEYYRRRAAGGLGLIITEGTLVNHPLANAYGDVPYLRKDTVEGWRKINSAIRAEGCACFVQIWHCGPQSRPGIAAFPVTEDGKEVVRAATASDRRKLLDLYRESAQIALESGFDGIELHAAHGYLLDSFLRSGQRDFVQQIVRATREEVGPDVPIGLRFSNWTVNDYDAAYIRNEEDLRDVTMPLAEAGVDVFHASVRRFWEPPFPGSALSLAGWTRRVSGKPTILVGSVGLDPSRLAADGPEGLTALAARMAAGEFDLVSVGRALIVDPEWVHKLRDSRFEELAPWYQGAQLEVYP